MLLPTYEELRDLKYMASHVNGLTASLLILDRPPDQELKEMCWNAFNRTNPSEQNQREFRTLLDRVTTAREM